MFHVKDTYPADRLGRKCSVCGMPERDDEVVFVTSVDAGYGHGRICICGTCAGRMAEQAGWMLINDHTRELAVLTEAFEDALERLDAERTRREKAEQLLEVLHGFVPVATSVTETTTDTVVSLTSPEPEPAAPAKRGPGRPRKVA